MLGRFAFIWALLTAAIAAGVGALAYNAGLNTAIVTHGGDVVAPAYPYYGYGGGFGFGWFIPLLFFILLLAFVFRGRRRWYGGGWYGHGHGVGHSPWEQRMQDWHRAQHGETPPPATGGGSSPEHGPSAG